jgi:hypothetical protein
MSIVKDINRDRYTLDRILSIIICCLSLKPKKSKTMKVDLAQNTSHKTDNYTIGNRIDSDISYGSAMLFKF